MIPVALERYQILNILISGVYQGHKIQLIQPVRFLGCIQRCCYHS